MKVFVEGLSEEGRRRRKKKQYRLAIVYSRDDIVWLTWSSLCISLTASFWYQESSQLIQQRIQSHWYTSSSSPTVFYGKDLIKEGWVQKKEKEIRDFLGRLQYTSRFISQLTPICEPIFKLLRKNTLPFKKDRHRNEDCQKAFDKVKKYLLNPPILVPPTPGRPLLMYLSVMEASMSCVLGQHDEMGRTERAIYSLKILRQGIRF